MSSRVAEQMVNDGVFRISGISKNRHSALKAF
jgi:hypothetical protein